MNRYISTLKSSLLMLVFGLAGCATHTFDLSQVGGEDRITQGDGINVRIVPEVGRRPEPITSLGLTNSRLKYETGPIWRRVFVGRDDAVATLEIVSTSLTENLAGMGFTTRENYEIEARLVVNGVSHTIHGFGSRAAALHVESARRQAVELAVVDAAAQAKVILHSSLAQK